MNIYYAVRSSAGTPQILTVGATQTWTVTDAASLQIVNQDGTFTTYGPGAWYWVSTSNSPSGWTV